MIKLILMALAISSTVAYGQMTEQTNVVRVGPNARIIWDPVLTAVGYNVKLTTGTNTWAGFTSTNSILLLALNTNIQSGNYTAEVRALNQYNTPGDAGITSTNLSVPPNKTFNVRFEGTITILP